MLFILSAGINCGGIYLNKSTTICDYNKDRLDIVSHKEISSTEILVKLVNDTLFPHAIHLEAFKDLPFSFYYESDSYHYLADSTFDFRDQIVIQNNLFFVDSLFSCFYAGKALFSFNDLYVFNLKGSRYYALPSINTAVPLSTTGEIALYILLIECKNDNYFCYGLMSYISGIDKIPEIGCLFTDIGGDGILDFYSVDSSLNGRSSVNIFSCFNGSLKKNMSVKPFFISSSESSK